MTENPILITILIGISSLLLLFLVVDFIKFRSLKKSIENKNIPENLHIDKYYELKWRINTLLTLVTIIGVMLGYLGIDIKSEITKEFEYYNTKIRNLDSLTNELENKIAKTDSVRNSIDSIFSDQVKKVNHFENKIDKTEREIEKIQNANLKQSQVYIVTGIPITIIGEDNAEQPVYYKDLKINTGQPLPPFKNPPVLHLLINEKNVENIRIIENTKDYFKITYFESRAITIGSIKGKEKPKLDKFDILISNQ